MKDSEFGRIALWMQKYEDGLSKPVLKGNIKLKDGTELKVSLWRNKSDNTRAPEYSGSIDMPATPLDDDIPF